MDERQSERLSILIVAPFHVPPLGGGDVRIANLIRKLSLRHSVSLLTYGDEILHYPLHELGLDRVAVYSMEPRQAKVRNKRVSQLLSLFSTTSYEGRRLSSQNMKSQTDAIIRERKVDIVQVEFSQTLTADLNTDVPVVLSQHNIEHELILRSLVVEKSPLRKLFYLSEFLKFRREELGRLAMADACTVTSEREKAIIEKHLPRKIVSVIPNGVDIEYFAPSGADPEKDMVVFTGSMDYRPNIDAALYFVNQILPLIVPHRPHLKLFIVGKGAPPELLRLAGPRVTVTGWVPDVRPYLARAAAVVAPLRIGSGTRLKVLEAMAMGKPVVSSSLGCEGLAVTPGDHLLVADDRSAFAGAVQRVLEDDDLAGHLGRNGRLLVEHTYGWETISWQLEELYRRLLARQPGDISKLQTPSAGRT